MATKDMDQAVPGFFDGTTNVELKQQVLSRLVRHLSRPGGDELEQEKLDVINAALDSLDYLNAGSEHLAERSRPRPEVKERVPAACPPWAALVTDDLPRRLQLLEELKNVSVHKFGGSGNGGSTRRKSPPAEADQALMIVMGNSGVVPQLERIPESESSSSSDYSVAAIMLGESEEETPPPSPPESPPGAPLLMPSSAPLKEAAARTMERDGGVCAVTGTPDAQAYHVFSFRAIRHRAVVSRDLKAVSHFWGYDLVEKFNEALDRGAAGLDSPRNMVTLNHSVRQRWDRAQATLEPVSSSPLSSSTSSPSDADNTGTDDSSLRLRWCFLPEVHRLGKRKRPFKWRNDLAQDPREVLACLRGGEDDVLRLFHKETLRPVREGDEVVINAEGKGERPDEWLWRLRHMMTCMAALVAAATPEGVGEEDSELDARDRQRLIREWVDLANAWVDDRGRSMAGNGCNRRTRRVNSGNAAVGPHGHDMQSCRTTGPST
ncbi:hypothetical protein CSOJ01_13021 [Colletotrichum sojae]|uniref:HNH nuclease domain-containing protein n=1 Tax=Colletotrichum sojae TaxID=2175907 RepID=A0A8H6ITC0_9PEZI|nr:hypothetical protein CSOJ01_13021 [Colletotrichum sojae]